MKKFILSIALFVFAFMSEELVAHNDVLKQEEISIIETVPTTDVAYEPKEEVLANTVVEKQDPYIYALHNMQEDMEEIESISSNKEWFLAYKDIVFKYAKWCEPPKTVFDVFNAEEVRLMCQTVETECYDRDFDSKCNVASVIFNRFYSGKFGSTIEEIITTPRQFAYFREKITEDSILAVMYAFEIGDTTNGALFFHSKKKEKGETFCGASYIFTDSIGHSFYK